MLKLVNIVHKKSLIPGDHIYAYRDAHLYSHQGIYIGEDRVIHYNKTQDENTQNPPKLCTKCGFDRNNARGVVVSCVRCFRGPHLLRLFRYDVSCVRFLASWPGTCTTGRADSPEVVVARAKDCLNRVEGFGDYNLVDNNCEVFALFCKTAKRVSNQASAAITALNARVMLLYKDVRVHHGETKHDEVKLMIDSCVANNTVSLIELVAHLRQNVSVEYSGEEEEVIIEAVESVDH